MWRGVTDTLWFVCVLDITMSRTDWDAIWDVDSGGPREPCIRWGPKSPRERGSYFGGHPFDGGLVAEWLACWTQAQKGPSSNRSRDTVG